MSRTLQTPLRRLAHFEASSLRLCAPPPSGPCLRDDLHPLIAIHSTRQQCQRQPFSTSRPWRANGMKISRRSQSGNKTQPSMAVERAKQKEQALRKGLIPDDIGLMPDTFVMPFDKKLPGLLSNPRGRWRLERHRIRTRLGELWA